MNGGFIKSILKGVLGALAVSAVLLFLFSYVCTKQADPKALTGLFGVMTLVMCSISGGFVAARSHKHSGIVCGACCGLVLACLLMCGSLAMGASSGMKWLLFLIVPAVAAVGGFFGVPSGKVKRRRRQK